MIIDDNIWYLMLSKIRYVHAKSIDSHRIDLLDLKPIKNEHKRIETLLKFSMFIDNHKVYVPSIKF